MEVDITDIVKEQYKPSEIKSATLFTLSGENMVHLVMCNGTSLFYRIKNGLLYAHAEKLIDDIHHYKKFKTIFEKSLRNKNIEVLLGDTK